MTIPRMIKPYCFMRNHFNKYIPLWSNLPWCLVTLVVYSMEDWGLQFHSLVPLVLSDNWSTHRFLKQQKSRHFEGSAPQSLKWVHWLQWMVWSSPFYHGSSFESEMGKAACQSQKHQTWKMARLKAKTSRQCSLNDTLAKWATVRQISVTKVQITSATQCMWDTEIVASLWSHHFQRYLYLNKSFLCLSISAHVSTGLSWSFRVFASPSARGATVCHGSSFWIFLKCTICLPMVLHCYMKSEQMSPVVSSSRRYLALTPQRRVFFLFKQIHSSLSCQVSRPKSVIPEREMW